MTAFIRTALMALLPMTLLSLSIPISAVQAAQPTTADIEKMIRRGVELRRQGKDMEALAFFQKAYEAAATPRTAAQLALCEMQLGYWLSAEAHLTEALTGGTDAWTGKYRKTLQDSLEQVRAQIGEVTITGKPDSAEVLINGQPSPGHLPLAPVRVSAGTVRVTARAQGYLEKTVSVTVTGKAQVRVNIDLEPDPSRRASLPSPAVAETRTAVVADEAGRSDKSWPASKIFGATLVGAGCLAVLGGATLLLLDKHESCDAPVPGAMCLERSRTRVPGWSLIGAGIGLGAVGGILLYRNAESQIALSTSPASLVVSGRF